MVEDYDDIQRIPIVTKSDLQSVPVEDRSVQERDRMQMNTGGTTGRPLSFYVDTNAFAREWAHMHDIWDQVEYSPEDYKITLRGENINGKTYVYNAVHNEFIVNTYEPFENIAREVLALVRDREIKYIHGYPSAIYEFARFCRSESPNISRELNATLQGVLLGSEYPAPIYREVIREVFDVPVVSWYGHSEMAILASERGDPYTYVPMHTYGHCETVPAGNGERYLVGTSYYNTASPFIRYNTEDLVQPVSVNRGLLQGFEVSSGRTGDFVLDRSGHRISLTALVFGRHHEIFNEAQFVQVQQEEPGRATILITPMDDPLRTEDIVWEDLFDASNVDLDLDFVEVDAPVRSSQGKVKLLVNP
jgi:phenylacetate-CoA ligase